MYAAFVDSHTQRAGYWSILSNGKAVFYSFCGKHVLCRCGRVERARADRRRQATNTQTATRNRTGASGDAAVARAATDAAASAAADAAASAS